MLASSRCMACLLMALAMLWATGCTANRHTFVSTVHSPKSVALIDTSTDEPIWAADLPVGTKLVIDLDVVHDSEWIAGIEPGYPTIMRWWLYPETSRKAFHEGYYAPGEAIDSGQVELPGVPARIDMQLRPSPEEPVELYKGMLTKAAPKPMMKEEADDDAADEAMEEGEAEMSDEEEPAEEDAAGEEG
ncbi:MAG: hypothetical protein MI741_24405 [Rhodospirillales bacterium]|nr:hypothetical protein [Rhodospirillales bacterium]